MSAEDRPVVSSILYGPDGTPVDVRESGEVAVVSRGVSIKSFNGLRETFFTTTATTTVVGRSGFWTDFGDGGQRSIKSTSAADSSGGTGIRTIRITYYRSDGSGPFTEDVTMNGTTGVALTETNLRFVETMEALTVGSGGVAAGNIDLVQNNDGSGGSLGRLLSGNTKTLWAQHWVPPGKTAHITSLFAAALSTGVLGSGSSGRIMVRTLASLQANAVQKDVMFGYRVAKDQGTIELVPSMPIQVDGPCLLNLWLRPDGTESTQWFFGFGFYDV